MEQIIKVTFHTPINGEREYYFSSLAAIYLHFSAEQIGCTLNTLWDSHLSVGNPKATKNCVISRHYISRKPQTNKSK